MLRRRTTSTAAPLFAAAALSYAANCSLGAAVATKLVDSSGFRWLHHGLYIATCTTTAVALAAGWWGMPQRSSRRAALVLAPATVPLAAIPFVGTHNRWHPLVALAAAPFIVAGLIGSLRPADRK
jgi:hypothetical protein